MLKYKCRVTVLVNMLMSYFKIKQYMAVLRKNTKILQCCNYCNTIIS